VEESDSIQEKVAKKRQQKRRAKKESDKKKGDHPDFGLMSLDEAVGQQSCRQTQDGIVNWYIVQGWFWREIKRVNPAWLVVKKKNRGTEKDQTWWAVKEKKLAHKLLAHYGPEVLERTVRWFVENWQAIKDRSQGKVTGAPTVQLLWASRERIFSDAEAGIEVKPLEKHRAKKRKRHMVGEYDDESASEPRIGWGDV
jgi:hypothetical protein